MRYGVDLDGVCFNFIDVFRRRLNDVYSLSLTQEDLTDYYWHKVTDDMTEEQFFSEFHKFGYSGGYRTLPVLPGTLDALDRIKNGGHEIFYITNRPEYARQDTVSALTEHGFPSSKNIFFTTEPKSLLVNKLNIGVFIEDSDTNIIDIAEHTDAYIYCVDYPYNRKIEHVNVERINDWDDFLLAEAI